MSKTQKLTFSALAAALVFVATWLIRFPTALGYVNAGDGLIILAGAWLGGVPGLIAGALGSALADLAAGYAVYAPVTAVIKGVMGLLAGLFLSKSKPSLLRTLLTALLCEAIMVGGYFAFESILYSVSGAAASVIPNIVQGAAGVILGAVTVCLLPRLRKMMGK